MNKKLLAFIIGLVVIGIAIFIFFTIFEIEEYFKPTAPSREAQMNEYLALDRWLSGEGYTVRVEKKGDLETLKADSQSVILIQASLFDWNEQAVEYLDYWVKEGGFLILCLDRMFWYLDTALVNYLVELGVDIDQESGSQYRYDSLSPVFDRNMAFNVPEDLDTGQDILILKDARDVIRLVQFSMGTGRITITGNPRFMTTWYIDEEPNSRLTWYLVTNGKELPAYAGSSILFVRGDNPVRGLLGRVFMLGNFGIIIIAGLILIVIGFWSAIPLFGVVRAEEEKPGKLLAERFLAEGRFLKRFNALDKYRDTYLREIRRKFSRYENLSDDEIIARFSLEKTVSKGRMKNRDFVESIKILRTTLELI